MMDAIAYQLKSDLARACFPSPERSAQRRLAWVNSICIFFLIIGISGAPTKLPPLRHPPPLEQPIPVIVEPLATPPPAAATKQVEPQNQDEKEIAPRVVAVTLNTPQVVFSVPTIGNVMVPMSAAPAPSPVELRPAAQAKAAPTKTGSTGDSGDRPDPEYPKYAEDLGQTGTVVLLFTVDDVGAVTSLSVKESSGFSLLDRGARDWIKRHWIQPPINGNHSFQTTIRFKLP
jgi:protein TonB